MLLCYTTEHDMITNRIGTHNSDSGANYMFYAVSVCLKKTTNQKWDGKNIILGIF